MNEDDEDFDFARDLQRAAEGRVAPMLDDDGIHKKMSTYLKFIANNLLRLSGRQVCVSLLSCSCCQLLLVCSLSLSPSPSHLSLLSLCPMSSISLCLLALLEAVPSPCWMMTASTRR